MTNYTTSTPLISDPDLAYGILVVGVDNTGRLLDPLSLLAELDPVFGASPAAGITTQKITNWDTAYGWGNHATAGYETTTQLNARDTANRNRANHTGTQLAATISDIGTTISANTDVAANTAARHAAVTVTDSSEIDFTLTGQNITASLINGSIGATRLSSGVNTSLGLANTALQPSTIGVTVQGYSAILAGITTQKITNWDTAYGWGNHATAGYLTTFTESDPVFGASPAAGITTQKITNWDTAYGWGNHATAGYETTTQLNARDTANRNRANHTGTQPWNTITGTPTTTAGYGITDAAFNGQIINGVAHFVQNAAPTTRIDAAGQNIGPLVAGDQWTKPTDNGIPGTAGFWIWTGSDWVSVNVFPLSIPFVNGSSNNQTIRSESAGTNLGIRVSGLASQIAVLNANPTSSNYWTAAISISGTPVTTLSTQNAVSYPHNYSTPNTVIPARASIPVGGTLTATALGQTSRQWYGMTTLGTDVYACVLGGDIYKQTNGTGDFLPLSQTSRQWRGMTTLGTNVYACDDNGDIYKQTNGTGNFIALGQTSRRWWAMTTLGTDVYVCVDSGDIYKQTNGTGNFVALGQTSRRWLGMTTLGTDVYACAHDGDIYKQTNGTGDFIALGQTSRRWDGMTTLGTDVYACVLGGDIYKQTNGTGDFIALGQTSRQWIGMTTLGTDVYVSTAPGDIYRLTAGVVTSIGHSLEVTLTRTGAASLPYVSITANCQVIHP